MRRRDGLRAAVLLLCSVFFCGSLNAAPGTPDWDSLAEGWPLVDRPDRGRSIYGERWEVIETPHFRVHYHASVAAIAEDVAILCEQAHELLVPIFRYAPSRPTDVVLLDETDSANGSARVVPNNRIRLHAYPPDSDSVLGDYDHWMWALIVHEYAHILHLDATFGLPALANIPFGKRFAPNAVLPRWLVEGIATYHESAQSAGGRVGSSLFDAYLRVALLEDRVPTLGALSGSPVHWPRATGWYLYGAYFVDWLSREYGWDRLVDFTHHYGRRVLPLGINLVAREHYGEDFVALWDRWLAEQGEAAREEARQLEAEGLTPMQWLSEGGNQTRIVGATPEGDAWWVRRDGHSPAALVMGLREAERRSVRLEGSAELAWGPGADQAIVSMRGPVLHAYNFHDLYLLDTRSGAMRRLTYGARAREPALSPDGRMVFHVAPEAGRTDLRVFDLETGEVRVVVEAPPWGQIARPDVAPDGGSVVYSIHHSGGGRDLEELDLRSGERRALTRTRAFDVDPRYSPCGEFVLFGSDRSGIFDVHALRRSDGEIRRLTRTLGGAYSPALLVGEEGDLLVFSAYRGTGFDAAWLPLGGRLGAQWERFEVVGEGWTRPPFPRPEVAPQTIASPRPHRVFRDTRVHDWLPVVNVGDGATAVGVGGSGADAAGRNAYVANLLWDVNAGSPAGSLELLTRRTYPALLVAGERTVTQRTRGYVQRSQEQPWLEERWLGLLSFVLTYPRVDATHSLGFSWDMSYRRPLRLGSVVPDPDDVGPERPEGFRRAGFGLDWSWRNLERYADSVSVERGTALGLSTRIRARALGGEEEGAELSAQIRHYVPLPRRHQVLAMRLAGGVGVSGAGRREIFVVGGAQPQDLFVSLLEQRPASTTPLRGIVPGARAGDRFYRIGVEYRVPIFNPDAGFATLPVYLGRLHGALFMDAGDAWLGEGGARVPLTGLGAELRMDTLLGFVQPASFRLGMAQGLGEEGEFAVYLRYGGAF